MTTFLLGALAGFVVGVSGTYVVPVLLSKLKDLVEKL